MYKIKRFLGLNQVNLLILYILIQTFILLFGYTTYTKPVCSGGAAVHSVHVATDEGHGERVRH